MANNSLQTKQSIEFKKLDDSTVSATINIGQTTIPDYIFLYGQYPLGGYSGLKFIYIKFPNEATTNLYYYAADNVRYDGVTVLFSISGTNLTIKIQDVALGQYRFYGMYNLYYMNK